MQDRFSITDLFVGMALDTETKLMSWILMVMLDDMFIDLCISMDSDVMEIYGRNYEFYFFFRYSHDYHCGCLGLLLLL